MVYGIIGRVVVLGLTIAILAYALGILWAAACMLIEGGPFIATLG